MFFGNPSHPATCVAAGVALLLSGLSNVFDIQLSEAKQTVPGK